ncbi:MAG TPA: AsmA family protein [Xanthobacteraceae bacterium]
MKRLGILVAGVIAIGVVALSAGTFLISPDVARDAVKAQIRVVTGLDPVLRGPVEVSLFPSGTVSLADVVLGEEQGHASPLVAERLVAHLRFLPLLIGRIEIADIALDRPHIAVEIDTDGQSNWSPLLASLARGLTPVGRIVSFSEIRINGGTLTVRDAERDLMESLTGVELSLAWPSISKSFGAIGRFVWRNEPVDASVTISDFLAALSGDTSGLKLRLSGAPLRLAFEGVMSNRPSFKVDGTLSADAASLRDALRWTGDTPLPGGGFGRFSLKAKANMVGGAMALSGVNLELDGNAAEGVLTYAANGRRTWQGQLAAEALDLTPYVSTIRLLTTNAREWDRMPIGLEGLTGFEIDLRLSAARVTIGRAKVGRTAVAASLRGGKLLITVGESQAFNGLIRGSLAIAKSETGADVRSEMQFSDVDLESCLGELFGLRRLEGKGNVSFLLEGAGGSVMNLTRTLAGTVSVTAQGGAFTGINVEQVLRRLERRPLSGGGDVRNGRTPFDRLNIVLKIANGAVTVEDASVDGAAVKIALTGAASIPARDLDLKGSASLLNGPNDVAFELPFVVNGTWDDAFPMPDPASLIRRSGAAAPLLDAVRDKKTRDAVRSALERLSGARPAAVEAPPAGPDTQ